MPVVDVVICRNPNCKKPREKDRLTCPECWKEVPKVMRTAYNDAKVTWIERGNMGYQIIYWMKEHLKNDQA